MWADKIMTDNDIRRAFGCGDSPALSKYFVWLETTSGETVCLIRDGVVSQHVSSSPQQKQLLYEWAQFDMKWNHTLTRHEMERILGIRLDNDTSWEYLTEPHKRHPSADPAALFMIHGITLSEWRQRPAVHYLSPIHSGMMISSRRHAVIFPGLCSLLSASASSFRRRHSRPWFLGADICGHNRHNTVLLLDHRGVQTS